MEQIKELAAMVGSLSTQLSELTSKVNSLSSQESNLQGNQQVSASALMAQLKNELSSASSTNTQSGTRHDEDVNATEAMKAYAPMWPLKANMQWAGEHAMVLNIQNQIAQITQNAITVAHQMNQEAASAYGHRLALGNKSLAVALGQPGYFHENAPASQDTPGEGSDKT